MQPISAATCQICGEGIASQVGEQRCSVCQQTAPAFVRACAYGAYDGELRDLIHLLKYEQVIPAAGILGEMLVQAIQKLEIEAESVLVVPVPLHGSKRRQRGFNQAKLIAVAALKRCGSMRGQLVTDVLARIRPTASQIGLTRAQRAENIRGAFRVRHLNKVSGRCVLLVDDVLTTGTTANECARVLRKAGAKQVWVATVARTLKETGTFLDQGDMQSLAAPQVQSARAS
jgi:ComF family protein